MVTTNVNPKRTASEAEQKKPVKTKKAPKQHWSDEELHRAIDSSVLAGIAAGRREASLSAKEAFRNTENRLQAFHVLLKKIKDDIEYLEQVQKYGTPEYSKSIVRYSSNGGSRITAEEKLEAAIAALKSQIAMDEFEAEAIQKAIDCVSADEYFYVVEKRYFENKSDEEIAEKFHIDRTTVWRNRSRLVRIMAVSLYGYKACE